MNTKLRVAVIGAGRLGSLHAQKLAAFDDVQLVAVVDPVAEQRDRLAAALGVRAVADHHEVLPEIDAAVIAAPTRLHYRLAMDCLAQGVHVFVEKPLCTSVAEADSLLAAAHNNDRIVQVGHIERFNPAFEAAAAHVRNPRFIEAVRTGGYSFRCLDVGVVLDLMIHDIELVLSLVCSPIKRVDALGLSVFGGDEDLAHARLEFHCGCVAVLSASRVSYDTARRMKLWSLRAYASVDFAARTATLIRPSEALLKRQFDVRSLTPSQVEYYREHLLEEHLPRQRLSFAQADPLALELRDFVDSIRTNRQPRVSGYVGRHALAVAEQVMARINTHIWDQRGDGLIGPLALPLRRTVPAPHLAIPTAAQPMTSPATTSGR